MSEIADIKKNVNTLFSKVNACVTLKVFTVAVVLVVGLLGGTYGYTYKVEGRVNAEALKQAEKMSVLVTKPDLDKVEARIMAAIAELKD